MYGVNGEFVGYAEDSFTVSEFDITSYVKIKIICWQWKYISAVRRHFWKTRISSGFWYFQRCEPVRNTGGSC